MRFCNFCFTSFSALGPMKGEKVQYIVYGLEKCPTTGRHHWQGYAEMINNGYSAKTVKQQCGLEDTCHIEPRKGTQEEAIVYCQKEGAWKELGTKKAPGTRSDLKEATSLLRSTGDIEDVKRAMPEVYVRYHKGLEALVRPVLVARRVKPQVKWYWGSTGAGKTRRAIIESKEDFYIKDPSTMWWDGYRGQSTIIIDDFRKWHKGYADLLRLLDWNPYYEQVKGGFIHINSPHIIITSNKSPRECFHYLETEEKLDQILRRIDEIVLITKPGVVERLSGNTNSDNLEYIAKRCGASEAERS